MRKSSSTGSPEASAAARSGRWPLRRPYTFPLILILVSLSVRLTVFVAAHPWDPAVAEHVLLGPEIGVDASEYHRLGMTLAQTGQFAFEKDGTPNAFRPPLYPLLLSLLYGGFGPLPWTVLLVQIAVDTLTCLLLFSIISRALNPGVGLLAGIFYGIDPFAVFQCMTVLSDTFFVFLCVAAWFILDRTAGQKFENERGRLPWVKMALAGILLGLSALTRPVGIYLFLPVAGFVLVAARARLRRAMSLAFVLAAGFGLAVLPWLLRNLLVFGAFSLTSNSGYAVLFSVTPMEMERRGEGFETVSAALMREADSLALRDGLSPEHCNEFQRARYWQTVGMSYVRRYPASYAKHYALGIVRMFGNLATRGWAALLQAPLPAEKIDLKAYPSLTQAVLAFLRQKTPTEIFFGALGGLFLVVSYSCLAVGLLVARKAGNPSFLVFSAAMVCYFVAVTGSAGLSRYRLPAVPFYLPFVALGAWFLWSRWTDRRAARRMQAREPSAEEVPA